MIKINRIPNFKKNFKEIKISLGLLLLTLPGVAAADKSIIPLAPTKQDPANPSITVQVTLLDYLNSRLNYLFGFIAILSALFIIIGGLQYVTSGGDEKNMEKAKRTLTYSIIGLVVTILSVVIIKFAESAAIFILG